MVNVDQKTEYQKFLENDLDKYIKEYQEIKIFKLVVSEQIKNLFFRVILSFISCLCSLCTKYYIKGWFSNLYVYIYVYC